MIGEAWVISLGFGTGLASLGMFLKLKNGIK